MSWQRRGENIRKLAQRLQLRCAYLTKRRSWSWVLQRMVELHSCNSGKVF
jgi:hypothetical protein